jgi:hypothetical protein
MSGCIFGVATVAVLARVLAAWAEGAWVMWNRADAPDAPQAWRAVTGFENRSACVHELGIRASGWKSSGWDVSFNSDARIAATSQAGVLELMCLPDTVDPRGPKTK